MTATPSMRCRSGHHAGCFQRRLAKAAPPSAFSELGALLRTRFVTHGRKDNQTMKSLMAVLISLTLYATADGKEATDWEAPIPNGAETDLVKLNLAAGNKRGADYIKSDVKNPEVELNPFVPDGLKTKAPDIDGLFIAHSIRRLPPDMLGTGPFYLIKRKDTYYLFTAKNFARLFAPVTRQEEILPLVTFYEKLFGNPFARVITVAKPDKEYETPPDVTKITATKNGFEVKLILLNGLRHAYFAEKHLLVHPDGMIDVTKDLKIIKDLGQGYVF